ncbi:tetratricopeptide repeat protein [Anaeramoeba flamelloides]|uniref:Tetratricopeptide repeat protein n=1 Tax=Anaeramoeba flamelloides TaxID=1746091 RepID=A0ABQ8X9P7_9EUKA|nr:tetratricopeptide repeat protein [Anaeramoeba flamelloides]
MTSKENIEVTEIEKKETESEETNNSNESEEMSGSSETSDSEIEELEEITEIELTEEQKKKRRELSQEAKSKGNKFFVQRDFESAIQEYTLAIELSFEEDQNKAIYFCNRAACHLSLSNWKECASDCSKTIKISPTYLKAYYRRGISYEHLEQYEESLQDFNKIKELNPRFPKLHSAIERITKKRDEKRTKDLEQMKSQLKNLGNTLLGKFGLSTDNFQVQKDQNSGSYSVQFKNN